jgi:two-component system sensor histidine kinase VicK
MVKFGIRARLLLLLMGVTIIPMVGLNIFWTTNQRTKLATASKLQQTAIAQNAASNVDAFLSEKIRALIIHSQSTTVQQLNAPQAAQELTTLFSQDKDIVHISLANQAGKELVSMDNQLHNSSLQDISKSDSFRVVNFLGGKEYVSPVKFDDAGNPRVTISVPLLAFTKPQDLGAISTAEPGVIRNQDDIKGVLVTEVDLGGLWQAVLATAKSSSDVGYAYVVDDKGTVIAHPDSQFARGQYNAAKVPVVSSLLGAVGTETPAGTPHSIEGPSEKNVPSLATYQKIPAAPWAVIFTDPLSSIYANVDQVSRIGLALTVVVILAAAVISIALSRYFTTPILRIAQTAEQIGQGNLDATVPPLRRHDEIATLGRSINDMGARLKKFVANISAERNQLEIILNSTAEGVIALDDQNRIVIANQAAGKLTQQPAESLVGQPVNTVFVWSKDKEPQSINYLAQGTATYEDLQYTTPDGEIHYVDLVIARTGQSVEGVQVIITIHDETKSRELDAMKLDFVSMAAHELRTPITGIRGYLELILYRFENELDEEIKKYVNHAHNSSIELIGLINNLLNISRIERGALTLSMDKVDWITSIQRTLSNAQFNAQEKHINLSYEGPSEDCFIVADTVAIQEVINNLVSNALKYTPEGGKVTVRLKHIDGHYLTEVSDTGIGIPKSAISNLFTKFYRVHGGLASGSGGTGLSLFISRSIVERHGGRIWVKSDEGKGSTFSFTLPVFKESSLANQQANTTTRRNRGWITKNIDR